MNSLKRGIVVFAVLLLAVSSVFAVETFNLKGGPKKAAATTTSSSKSTTANGGLTVKAGYTHVSALFYLRYSGSSYSDNLGIENNGITAGVKWNKLYADLNLAFAKDFTINSRSAKSAEYEGSASINSTFFGLSVGRSLINFNIGKLSVMAGIGAAYNTVKCSISVSEGQMKISVSSIGLHTLVDLRFAINDRIGVCLTVNPQIGIVCTSRAELIEGSSREVSTSNSTSGSATPVTFGVTYKF